MSINQRIKILIKDLDLSQSEFARETNIPQATVSTIYLDKNLPKADVIEKILVKYKNISARWLLTGEGEMYTNKPYVLPDEQTKVIKEPEQAYKQSTQPDESERIKEYKEQIDMQREFIAILRQQALDLRAEVDRLRQQIQEQEQKKKR